jgi:hypothetical protein
MTGVTFKRDDYETTVEYWVATTYDISGMELLRKKDKRKFKKAGIPRPIDTNSY